MKEHLPGCPRLQFWDAGEWECPCLCDEIREQFECPLSPTGKHEYMGNGHCKWCKEHFRGD